MCKLVFAMLGLLVLVFPVSGAEPGKPGVAAYMNGIEQLEAAKYSDAAASFSKAIDEDEDSADYRTARGVAHTLAQKFPEAIKDLQRATQLRGGRRDSETNLWLAAALSMSGNVGEAAGHFYVDPTIGADYCETVYLVMASEYSQAQRTGSYFDRESRKTVRANGPVTRSFSKAAGYFVRQHNVSSEDAIKILVTRGKERLDKGDYAAALKDLGAIIASGNADVSVWAYHADCLLALGAPGIAREEYTQALLQQPNAANLYLSRAAAAARMGDVKRAKADLAYATKFNAAAAEKARPSIEKQLNFPVTAPLTALAALENASRAGASAKELLDKAMVVHHAVNAGRILCDEAYQSELARLGKSITEAKPNDPNDSWRWSDLAEFYRKEADVPVEWVCPRLTARPFRFQTPAMRQQELAWAEQSADKAFKLNPIDIRAFALKVYFLLQRDRTEATQFNNENQVNVVFADNPLNAVADAELQALRAEYANSDEDKQKFSQRAIDALLNAAQRHKGRVEESYYTALARWREGKVDEAQTLLEKAVKTAPGHQLSRAALARLYAQLQMPDEALEQEAWAVALRHTTVSPILKAAWGRISRTAYKSAKTALKIGPQIDASDARIAAYLAIISLADEKTSDAIADLRTAVALEEARVRMRGHTFETNDSIPTKAEEIGVLLAVRSKLGAALVGAGKVSEATEALRANIALEPRVASELTQPLYSAMLPEPTDDPTRIPEAPTVASVLANSHWALGNGFFADKRYKEAEAEFRAVRAYTMSWPATAHGRESLYEVDTRAFIGLCKVLLAQGRAQEAMNLGEANPPWGNRALENELRAILEKVRQASER